MTTVNAVAEVMVVLMVHLFSSTGMRCPDTCDCADGVELEFMCSLPDGNFTIYAVPTKYITLECQYGTFRCDELPRLPSPRNETLQSLGLKNCPLPDESFACILEALGARGTTALTLQRIVRVTTLGVKHLTNLPDIRTLTVLDAGETGVPRDALATLTGLRRLTIRNATLHLEPEAFRGSPLLEYLELSMDHIVNIPSGTFRGLSALKVLGLWRNDITRVEGSSFEGLDSLEQLDLSSNLLRSIAANSFVSTPFLREIRITQNPLEDLWESAFAGLSQLEVVTVEDTRRVKLRVGARAFSALPALVALRVSRCDVQELPYDMLSGSRALRNLTLSHNRLQHVPSDLLRDQIELQQLDISYNEIKSLTPELFSSLKQLKELNLDRNLIEELTESLFFGLTNVKSISINNNRIHFIADNAFMGVLNVDQISLANNEINLRARLPAVGEYLDFGPSSPFNSLTVLRSLDLSGNRIVDVFADWRLVLINLEMLNLSHNHITEITDADVNFISRSVIVDLRHNNITRIFLNTNFEEHLTTVDTTNNARILLDDNPLICDCELFGFVRRLEGFHSNLTDEPLLDIGSAQCAAPTEQTGRLVRSVLPSSLTCDLPSPACPQSCQCKVRPGTSSLELNCETELPFTAYPNPTVYGLNGTFLQLQHPPTSLTALPPNVLVLNLTGLGLKEAPSGPAPRHLRMLDLTNNQLTRAPLELFTGIDRLTLLLDKNPLKCDCTYAAAIAELQLLGSNVSDYNNLKCASGELLWRVDSARLCDRVIATGAIISVTLIGFVAIAMAALCRRYEREVKIFLYSRGWFQSWLSEELDRDKLYDVFISFSHQDVNVVQDELLPKLEGEPYYLKACVHYRDWGAGDCIPIQIQRSVEQSRRTIIVLSRNFLESEWAALEFRAAHKQTLHDARSRVVVMLLEDVADDPRLDDDLRAYLATNTYVKWGETWFWEKLLYALPRRPAYPKNRAPIEHNNMACLASDDKLSRGGGMQVQLTSDGKLVNAALLKDCIATTPSCVVHF